MNANAETNITPTTADIEKRIADERNRLNAELSLQGRLQAQRMPALESGDDAALDVIEANLAGCLDRQSRIEERIELLTARLEQSKTQDESTRLDDIAASADRARIEGEKLITGDYVKHAKALAAVLHRLAAAEATIESCNLALTRAGRPQIPPANTVRCTPPERINLMATKRVEPYDAEHPLHEHAQRDRGGWFDSVTKERIGAVEIAITKIVHVDGYQPEPLHRVVQLPSADARPASHVVDGRVTTDCKAIEPIYKHELIDWQRPMTVIERAA
jgi:hypothetical protein